MLANKRDEREVGVGMRRWNMQKLCRRMFFKYAASIVYIHVMKRELEEPEYSPSVKLD